MKATGWTNGQGTYGIRVGIPNRKRYFDPRWTTIELEIDGQWHVCQLTPGFWRRCPEIRHPAIRAWLQRKGLIPWLAGQPPEVELTPIHENRFGLSR